MDHDFTFCRYIHRRIEPSAADMSLGSSRPPPYRGAHAVPPGLDPDVSFGRVRSVPVAAGAVGRAPHPIVPTPGVTEGNNLQVLRYAAELNN